MHYKYISLLLITGITYITAFAQPRIKDQGVIGGDNYDNSTSMYLTKDGGLIVGGTSLSNISDQKTEKSRGGSDYWVVKLDSNRVIRWDKTIGGSDYDYLQALQQTTDGGYILGGFSYSGISAEKTANSRGGTDYWIVKLDAAGNIQWDKTIGGSAFDDLYALQQTTDGGYILGGQSYSNKSGEKTENSKGSYDYWIVKLDANGNIQWDKTIGGSDYDRLQALQQTTDGGYILGGFSYSGISGDKTQNSRGSGDYWIVKLNASGNIQWDKTIGGSSYEVLYALQQTTDGGYIAGGYSYSDKSGEKTQNSRGDLDYWIVKLDGSGAIQWDKTMGGNSEDVLRAIQQTIDGGYILSGYSSSNISGEKKENSRGSEDYWVVKVNSLGKVQWNKTIGGSSPDYSSAVREIKKNDYAVSGWSFSGISGDKTGGNRTHGKLKYSDYWLVELRYLKSDSTAILPTTLTSKLNAPLNNSLIAFPNPVHDKLTIQSTGKATFTLTNQQGKILLTQIVENTGTIDLSTVPAGVYYLTNTITGASQKIIVYK